MSFYGCFIKNSTTIHGYHLSNDIWMFYFLTPKIMLEFLESIQEDEKKLLEKSRIIHSEEFKQKQRNKIEYLLSLQK